MAPERGLEPLTRRLTAGCSTIELLWNPNERAIYNACRNTVKRNLIGNSTIQRPTRIWHLPTALRRLVFAAPRAPKETGQWFTEGRALV